MGAETSLLMSQSQLTYVKARAILGVSIDMVCGRVHDPPCDDWIPLSVT